MKGCEVAMLDKERLIAEVEKMPKEEFISKFRAALDKSHINYEEGFGQITWSELRTDEATAEALAELADMETHPESYKRYPSFKALLEDVLLNNDQDQN